MEICLLYNSRWLLKAPDSPESVKATARCAAARPAHAETPAGVQIALDAGWSEGAVALQMRRQQTREAPVMKRGDSGAVEQYLGRLDSGWVSTGWGVEA